jgi:hypothetical protein
VSNECPLMSVKWVSPNECPLMSVGEGCKITIPVTVPNMHWDVLPVVRVGRATLDDFFLSQIKALQSSVDCVFLSNHADIGIVKCDGWHPNHANPSKILQRFFQPLLVIFTGRQFAFNFGLKEMHLKYLLTLKVRMTGSARRCWFPPVIKSVVKSLATRSTGNNTQQ